MLNLQKQKALASFYNACFDAFEANEHGLRSPATGFDEVFSIEQEILEFESENINPFDCFQLSGEQSANDFVNDLKRRIKKHAANRHRFYTNYLPKKATVADVSIYLAQETLQDPRFDDFIAYLQIGLPVKIKLELASNYWDEMGNGVESKSAHCNVSENYRSAWTQ